jgi:hypothetical protein
MFGVSIVPAGTRLRIITHPTAQAVGYFQPVPPGRGHVRELLKLNGVCGARSSSNSRVFIPWLELATLKLKIQGGTNMGQDTRRVKDEDATGRNLPDADGTVSDEDVNAIADKGEGKTGQDHSLDNYGETFPDHGVGGVQNESDPARSRAHIVD